METRPQNRIAHPGYPDKKSSRRTSEQVKTDRAKKEADKMRKKEKLADNVRRLAQLEKRIQVDAANAATHAARPLPSAITTKASRANASAGSPPSMKSSAELQVQSRARMNKVG